MFSCLLPQRVIAEGFLLDLILVLGPKLVTLSQFLTSFCQGRENSELYASFYKLLLSTGNTGVAARGAHTWSLVLEECSTKQSVICCSTNILFFSY